MASCHAVGIGGGGSLASGRSDMHRASQRGPGDIVKVCEVCRARFRGNAEVCPLDGGTLRDLPDPLVGRTVAGRYVIAEKIGAGGMGSVYRARHEVVGRDVAIKFLAPELAIDPTSRTRFLREAKAANRIKYEHIIDITDYGETDDGLVFLVMEYLDGVPLNEEIANGPMRPARALDIALQVAQALARAHELDVIHRDIKPDNIYLLSGYDGDFVKILDFGLAQMKGELRLTATGTVFGTPEYMAPEQARGSALTAAVDLYALGCVLFEMLTAELPFAGTTPELILQHLREPAPAPSRRRANIPKAIDDLVQKLLEKEPEARHRDAFHLCEEIKRALASLPDKTSHRPSSKRRRLSTAEALSRTMSTDEAWRDRTELFQSLIALAHPAGDAPEWLAPAVEKLAALVTGMGEHRLTLDRLAGQASQKEEEMRQAALRIGRALDELARDESRVLGQIVEVEKRVEDAASRLKELDKPLLRAWGSVPALPISGPELTRDVVEALRDAGSLASIWIEAERSVALIRRDLAERQRERDDLRFQISQLKGRMGGLGAEADAEAGSLRAEMARLDSELRRNTDEVVRDAEPIMRHFLAYPALRPYLLGGDAAPRSQVR